MTRVVLGSASPGRLKVLRQAGIDPLVVISGIDEDAVVAALGPDANPATITVALATAKAERVAEVVEPALAADCVVIGCDSMLYCDGQLRGKPESEEVARLQWQAMAGRTAQLHTGHCVIRLQDNTFASHDAENVVTTIGFGTPSESELQDYIASGEPLRVAGGFTLDGLGGWFIDGVDGDPSSVIGISLPLMRRMFERAGLSIAELWRANPVS
jgi:septum formation protein